MFIRYMSSNRLFVLTTNIKKQIIEQPLRKLVKQSIKNYLSEIENKNINNLYKILLSEIEQPLLDLIMQFTRGNQTQAALIMGINRGTLRKKLKMYGMN
ncbi:DNA-binding protein [Buchnera aphidicola (Nipponaphis monzeni)]|uniref:Putative Fis-like DNA-binding protein n=1 Tax=Buchnera aphidicola (Nipponaphis monzeni) TaxID=2495405 RepID=A0A455TAH6_9GAMM|nr:DNA-binding transcriptional regulator Fis [Buchnera aphidicola]BBI01318.1 DNA-binding protein [Buchnera aphidicola (Nipponaphis monzeni)]